MQQSLADNVENLQRVNDELQHHNEELANAYQLKLETNRRKTAFIQDMYHEIRTPLNIISGFAQVLFASLHALPEEEVNDIMTRMRSSAKDISRLTRELSEVSKPTK
jgi:sigma-B regulation protein RsbU (phosphoserine phosphatase)